MKSPEISPNGAQSSVLTFGSTGSSLGPNSDFWEDGAAGEKIVAPLHVSFTFLLPTDNTKYVFLLRFFLPGDFTREPRKLISMKLKRMIYVRLMRIQVTP